MRGLMPEAFGRDPSSTAVFDALPEADPEERPRRQLSAVVIGGGTGAPVSIRTLLSMGVETNAVVAMADDGGSTGILRDLAGATAPGDIRKCITAMAGSSSDPLTQAFKVRFGFAAGHTLGNLMLSALEATTGSFPEAIAICEQLLDAQGHVYPSTLDRVTLVAQTRDGRMIEGQAVASHSRTALRKVALRSSEKIVAYGEAVSAIERADLIVLGPGSLYTSIIPNLVVPGIIDAIRASNGVVVFVCSLADAQGETRGMAVGEHYEALTSHGMEGLIDFMIVHDCNQLRRPSDEALSEAKVSGKYDDLPRIRRVEIREGDFERIRSCGTTVISTDLVEWGRPTWHDPVKLRHAFAEVFRQCRAAGR